MKQSRWMSLLEAVLNVLVGYGVAVATQLKLSVRQRTWMRAPVELGCGLLGFLFLDDALHDLHRGQIARQHRAHHARSLLDADVWTPVGDQPTQRLLALSCGRSHQAASSSLISHKATKPVK